MSRRLPEIINHDHRPARDFFHLDADQRDRGAVAGLNLLDGSVVILESTDAERSIPRQDANRSAVRNSPDHTVPVTTVPVPFIVKTRSTGRRKRSLRRRATRHGASQPRSARARARRSLSPWSPTTERSGARKLVAVRQRRDVVRTSSSQSSSTRSLLVSATTPRVTPSMLEDREVLARLRHDAFVGGDDEQRDVDARRAGDHRADERLVAGHVDDADGADAVEHERREAEVDRDAAALLLGQPIGVDAGERAYERRLAVIDVAGGAEDHAALQAARFPGVERLHGPTVGEMLEDELAKQPLMSLGGGGR